MIQNRKAANHISREAEAREYFSCLCSILTQRKKLLSDVSATGRAVKSTFESQIFWVEETVSRISRFSSVIPLTQYVQCNFMSVVHVIIHLLFTCFQKACFLFWSFGTLCFYLIVDSTEREETRVE